MEYLYFFANVSLTLRVVEYLHALPELPIQFVTVVYRLNGWVVRVKMFGSLDPQQDGNLRAVMRELGVPHCPTKRLAQVFLSLAAGHLPIDVMRCYQVSIIAHGMPDKSEIEAFRHHYTVGLGYCPGTLT